MGDAGATAAAGATARRPSRRHARRVAFALSFAFIVAFSVAAARVRAGLRPSPWVEFAPTVVYAPDRLEGAVVRGASRDWALHRGSPLRYGEPVPVSLTAYCLKGLTRRNRYTREGIVAADPRLFPLARYLEIYVGRKYVGRFLIDDTGKRIKGNRLDVWTPTCSEARRFGMQRGTAVLVPRPAGGANDTLLTGRIGGKRKRSDR